MVLSQKSLPMSTKHFVSLSFSSSKLQILKLNTRKTAVEKFTAIDFPEGLIRNYQIIDRKGLASLIIQAWQRLQLKEKSVVIVIPEFSAFTKSLEMPKLSIPELDEGIRWQAQDFLPSDYKSVIMDWKIVKKVDDTIRVLVVAVPKHLLSGYVEAVAEAGLLPLAVETPSLSIERIADGSPEGKILIYTNWDEAILTVVRGEEILGSSVVSAVDVRGIVWTAVQMIRHYQDIEVKKIEVGGLDITQELLAGLAEKTHLKVEWLQATVSGFSPEQVQEYLIPISLQRKDPTEPRDEKTINLLPPKWVKKYSHKRLRLQIWTLLIIVTLVIGTCFLAVLGTYLILAKQVKVQESYQVSQENVTSEEISGQVNAINELADKTLKITSISQSPQLAIEKINNLTPQGISLYNYRINFDTGEIFLKGVAAHRELLIQFKQVLEADEDFQQISLPISSLEKESNLDFELSGVYAKVTVNKKQIKIPIP